MQFWFWMFLIPRINIQIPHAPVIHSNNLYNNFYSSSISFACILLFVDLRINGQCMNLKANAQQQRSSLRHLWQAATRSYKKNLMATWPVLKKDKLLLLQQALLTNLILWQCSHYCSVRDLETPRSPICCSSIKTCNNPLLPREKKSRHCKAGSLVGKHCQRWQMNVCLHCNLEIGTPPRGSDPLCLSHIWYSLSNLKTCFLLSLSSFKYTWCASQFGLLLHSLKKNIV